MIGLELVRNTIPGIDIKKTIVDDILPGPYFNYGTLPNYLKPSTIKSFVEDFVVYVLVWAFKIELKQKYQFN